MLSVVDNKISLTSAAEAIPTSFEATKAATPATCGQDIDVP